jgi:Silicon transporter
LAIEFSGLLHFTYIIQQVISSAAGKPIESNEPPRNSFQQIFFYGRCLFSLGAVSFAFTIVLGALFQGKSKMWDSVPPIVSVIIFFVLLFIIGQLEASQIAYFAVTKLRECERGEAMFAKLTCAIIFKGDGRNLQAFIIGRQLCVVSCMFFVARITSIQLEEGDPNILGIPDWAQAIVDTGLLGALCVAIIGSMMWRLLAASFPIFFLSFPVTYILLRWCMILESTGIMHGAWVLAALHKKIAGFQRDEVYIGTAEDRAAMQKGDGKLVIGPGHVTALVDVGENPLDFTDFTESRSKTLSNIKVLYDLIGMSGTTEDQKIIYRRSLAQEIATLDRFNKENGTLAAERQILQMDIESGMDVSKKDEMSLETAQSEECA